MICVEKAPTVTSHWLRASVEVNLRSFPHFSEPQEGACWCLRRRFGVSPRTRVCPQSSRMSALLGANRLDVLRWCVIVGLCSELGAVREHTCT